MTTEEKLIWLHKEIGDYFDLSYGDECIDFYYKAMHDYGMNICDADDYAWLNTLFNYDIGADRAIAITNWIYENMDSTACEVVDVDYKGTLKNICELELGFKLDFTNWSDEEPKTLRFGY